jgi:rhodanese-related sulfurtransferase
MQHATAFLALVADAKKRIKEIDVAGYLGLQKAKTAHVLIDTREDSEWAKGHLPGAQHLCKGVIERDIEARVPDKGALIVLYCGGGLRSALAADSLQKMGYTNVVSMDGGWHAWNERQLPVEN